MTFTGSIDRIVFEVGYNTRDLYYDRTVENRHLGKSWSHRIMPSIDVDETAGMVKVYWQGQRRNSLWNEATQGWDHVWDLMPDLGMSGPDNFVFHFLFSVDGDSYVWSQPFREFDDGVATYHGQPATQHAFSTVDRIELYGPGGGKGKKNLKNTVLRFEAQSFTASDPDLQDGATNIEAKHTARVTNPDGTRFLVFAAAAGRDPSSPGKEDIYMTRFSTGALPGPGCYQIDLMGAYGIAPDRNVVWDSSQDPVGSAPIAVVFDGQAISVTYGLECGG
jgi:hypothetical protein